MSVSTQDRGGDYEAAVTTLYNLQSNAESIARARKQRERHRQVIVPNMRKFIQRSGLTTDDLDRLSVIHVSGTKGKGSTCAFCEQILRCHGHKTGLFTSPHLTEVRERIRVNGRPIGRDVFSRYFWQVYNRLKDTETSFPVDEGGGMPAYFAFLTVLSLHVFIGEKVEVAVVEVGIGGQYDSTNFLSRPVVCGMSSLGLDHTAMLGNTLSQIAWNKAGIFKPGRPAICVEHKPEAMEVVLRRAKEIQCPVFVSTPLTKATLARYGVTLGIAGDKQAENASLAVQLFRVWERDNNKKDTEVEDLPNSNNFDSPEQIPRLETTELHPLTVQGLNSCVWPGRAQTLRRPGLTYFLDGAHTQESIEVCTRWFSQEADRERKSVGGRVARILVFNLYGDREPDGLLACLQTCGFDAAVFCPNQVSLLESGNKADQLNVCLHPTDQLNKTVSLRSMKERAEKNKACWDRLIPAHTGDEMSGLGEDITNNNNAVCNVKKVDATAGSHTAPKKRKLDSHPIHNSVKKSTAGLDPANKHPRTNGHDIPSDSHTHQSSSGVSHLFPSISHALAWVTHGRDALATPPDDSSPGVPDWLRDSDHVQVLVTGSFHLVGGVLTVIDPHMND